MSWKAVEMQIALPRTQDAGRIQGQNEQRGHAMQEAIAQMQLQSEEIKRRSVADLEKGYKLKKEAREALKSAPDLEAIKKQLNHTEAQKRVTHPYLGRRIDINS